MIGTRESNAILLQCTTPGCSASTAAQDNLRSGGVEASNIMAKTDYALIANVCDRFKAAAARVAMPPALIAGIASRESRCGAMLVKGWGDSHHAFGICQVDCRSHVIEGIPDPKSIEHLIQVCSILRSFYVTILNNHPTWTLVQQLRGAVASYNVGPGNVRTIGGMDKGTTGDDYSADVWARAIYYATHSL
jgi:soluble lytic murein transglycosylase-like protein